jgi:HAD superfamily hydrolase (TIGR01509 family)
VQRGIHIVRAFLFDLDGTLVDTERLWVESTRIVLQKYGYDLSHGGAVDLAYGRGWHDIWADIARRYPHVGKDRTVIEQEMREEFLQLRSRLDVRIHSSIALLRRLAADHPVAIVSGSPRHDIRHALEQEGLGDCVRFYFGAEDYPRGKPDPSPYTAAAEKLGVPAAECLVFEDSRAGVRSAKAAGMTVVALRRDEAPDQDLSEADEVLTDLADFDLRRYTTAP